MESPRKFNDCYFYYYSTCTKGDNCVFRHEPSALGCETMCTAWQQGKCFDKKCRLRHMELRKNRKQIPCYWENQPGGCRKKHCPFMHKNPDARTDGIAPSQPAPVTPVPANSAVAPGVPGVPGVAGVPGVPDGSSGVAGVAGVTGEPPLVAGVPGVAPLPLLWQQQRQVVLDSGLLGVVPAGGELIGARPPYALPVDPLVVNFEEESDNESAPSSTPTKPVSEESQASAKSQELMLLEKIQAEAAAYYNYDELKDAPSERKIVRTNLTTKYDRLSLDEMAGKKNTDKPLDFKVLSLDEIRARKRGSDAIIHAKPITLNINRKRKLSAQETIIDSGKKIIKVVRSNSIVYKKVEENASNTANQTKPDQKPSDSDSRKRTFSEQSDIYDYQDDELDDCYQFKRVKLDEHTYKPRLIRNISTSSDSKVDCVKETNEDIANKTDDSDAEVQIVGEAICSTSKIDTEVIEIEDNVNQDESVDVVDLSDDSDSDDVIISDLHNVPDVVASCQKLSNKANNEEDVLGSIDALLNEEL